MRDFMIELPEAFTLATQINKTIIGKKIAKVTAAHTPHKLAWYYGDPDQYSSLLVGHSIDKTEAFGALVQIDVADSAILFGDGVNLRFHEKKDSHPKKHQLLVEFEDLTAISASVQMYGGVGCFREGTLDNPYYQVAREKPSPLTKKFSEKYFLGLISAPEVQKLSAKAFLATEQRIPGIGNGVLQDILLSARVHPKKKINTFSDKEKKYLFNSTKTVLQEMSQKGGRDTEKDLFGNPGGYETKLSKMTFGRRCQNCGSTISRENYLGGSIYFCAKCQKQ
jgi:formamidopyrimidine-DNA glycosylase